MAESSNSCIVDKADKRSWKPAPLNTLHNFILTSHTTEKAGSRSYWRISTGYDANKKRWLQMWLVLFEMWLPAWPPHPTGRRKSIRILTCALKIDDWLPFLDSVWIGWNLTCEELLGSLCYLHNSAGAIELLVGCHLQFCLGSKELNLKKSPLYSSASKK